MTRDQSQGRWTRPDTVFTYDTHDRVGPRWQRVRGLSIRDAPIGSRVRVRAIGDPAGVSTVVRVVGAWSTDVVVER